MAIATVSTAPVFGVVALLLAIVSGGLAVTRQSLGIPLMLARAHGNDQVRYSAQRSLSVSLVVGAVVAIVVICVGVATDRADIAVPIALAIPFVFAQDVYRYLSISLDRAHLAFWWDGVWAGISLLALLASWFNLATLTTPVLLVVWGAAALLCCAGLSRGTRITPRTSGLTIWASENLSHRLRFALEAVLGSVSVVWISAISAILIGPVATAALRGTSVVVGPLNILFAALPLLIVPQSARKRESLGGVIRRVAPFALAMSILSLVVGIGGPLLPEPVGRLILGETWSYAAALLPYIGLEYFAVSWLTCPMTAFLARGMSRDVLLLRILFVGLSVLVCTAAAAFVGTATSIAVGLAVVAAIMLAPAWALAMRRMKSEQGHSLGEWKAPQPGSGF